MNQITATLRRAADIYGDGIDGYVHWCPGCNEAHLLPDSWTFNDDLASPTFAPSFKHTMPFHGRPDRVCHYILTSGVLNFCGDSTHELAGAAVPLPPLPAHLVDA